jgi:hypothetical protein
MFVHFATFQSDRRQVDPTDADAVLVSTL